MPHLVAIDVGVAGSGIVDAVAPRSRSRRIRALRGAATHPADLTVEEDHVGGEEDDLGSAAAFFGHDLFQKTVRIEVEGLLHLQKLLIDLLEISPAQRDAAEGGVGHDRAGDGIVELGQIEDLGCRSAVPARGTGPRQRRWSSAGGLAPVKSEPGGGRVA